MTRHHVLTAAAPFVVVAFLAIAAIMVFDLTGAPSLPKLGSEPVLPAFASCNALQDALKEAQSSIGSRDLFLESALGVPTAQKTIGDAATAYSTTNVQVEGVDEGDIVKTDGTFIYTLSRNQLSIVRAYPPDTTSLRSQTKLELQAQDMFIDDDRLVVFGSSSPSILTEDQGEARIYPPSYQSFAAAEIWDISDRNLPKRLRTVEIEGAYVTSRKIGSQVYFISNSYPDFTILEDPQPVDLDIVPLYRDTASGTSAFSAVAGCAEVAYFPDVLAEQFITVASFDIDEDDSDVRKETILGSGQNVYASPSALYIAATEYNGQWWLGLRRDEDTAEKTTVHVFDLEDGAITYRGNLEAPGHVLNQFSMDEFDRDFRIATTVGEVSRAINEESQATSGIYVYDSTLKQIGNIDQLAPGERIYSARFIGERAYLVTFQKVDPLFVIDLSDSANPALLGKLKIPGYSDYLHPYDENHIIGLGKEAVAADEGNFAWYQGLKLALFDVTDVENPKELHKLVIGDRGSDSYALHDHKAFLFDRARDLLVIPVLLAQIPEDQKTAEAAANTYGDFIYQGAYVFSLTLKDGFVERGRVTHYADDETFKKSGYYYYGDGYSVKRSLYIGEYLYTISDNQVSVNVLNNLAERAKIPLCTTDCESPVRILE